MTDRRFVIPIRTRVRRKQFMAVSLTLITVLMIFLLNAVISEYNGLVITTSPDPGLEELYNPMDPGLRRMWLINKETNEDYIGQIVFDSGLIDLPIVQAKSVYRQDKGMYTFYSEEGELISDPIDHTGNDVYIWTDWKTFEYDPLGDGGSVFMDYRNSLNDQNLIIYGHHFARDYDPSGSKLFTPLDLLLTRDNYEDNKYLSLILDKEIRRYVVTNVFTISVSDEYEIQIIRTDMDKDLSGNAEPRFFGEFISYINKISKYETGNALDDGDQILTLITCLQHQPEYRQVIVCRQFEDIVYTD